ncbi:MAG: ribonuclease H family protein [Porphyromonadaceae bacterium]|nr:ribonuclease H family protein [Porphyromonadaceae bacterium]
MAQKKFYVVWQGVKPGIYTSWEECKKQVSGFENARYKSFPTREEAERALLDNPWKHLNTKKGIRSAVSLPNTGIIKESLAVDAACSGNPGLLEYRGVYVAENKEVFHVGPLEEGTNNIGEFLAIVHALALLKKHQQNTPIYSDSVNAIKWVAKKKCNTKLEQSERNKPLFELIARAEMWLQNNSYQNPILKWETKQWGEIPADFGRK